MLKIGLAGVGHLGKIHAKCIAMIDEYDFIGFFDPSDENAALAIQTLGLKRYDRLEDLLNEIDVLDIVTPTIHHFEVATSAIQAGKHIFIEKPLTTTIEEADELRNLAKKYNIKVQVGHVERFNPAILSLKDKAIDPRFIEAHRLANFNPRGTDVSVVMDLMIHDIDIVMHFVKSKVVDIKAVGVKILSPTSDICNARLEFENGCVANLTASRLSIKQMRKIRLFQKDAYISLDFLEKTAQVVRIKNEQDPVNEKAMRMPLETNDGTKILEVDIPATEDVNAIKLELFSLYEAISNDTDTLVNIEDGYNALKVAHQIMDIVKSNTQKIL